MVERAGNIGISALVVNRGDRFSFRMQSRAVAIGDEESFINNDMPLSINFNITFTTGMKHCPFCGAELESLINEKTKQGFQDLAERHSQIDNSL